MDTVFIPTAVDGHFAGTDEEVLDDDLSSLYFLHALEPDSAEWMDEILMLI